MEDDLALALRQRVESLANAAGYAIDAGKYEDALKYSNEAIDEDGTYAGGWITKSLALARLGRPEEAHETVDKAEKCDINNVNKQMQEWLARAYAVLGNHEKALRHLRIYLQLAVKDAKQLYPGDYLDQMLGVIEYGLSTQVDFDTMRDMNEFKTLAKAIRPE